MRVLLVEDGPDLGAAIKRILNQEKYVVDWVQDGTEAWNYLEDPQTQYTLAIFDWLLPGLSGLELCKRVRSQQSPLPILMLTAKDQMEDKVAGLDAGADDYLVKPFGMEELLARLRALQRRSPQLQPQQLTVGSLTLDYSTRTVCFQNTLGEQQVIPSSDQIRNQLWEVSAEPISNVVAAQVRLLRRKLASFGCPDLIETLHGMGYRFNPTHASK
jgi:DNA-binding response OmpR family regulator